MQCWSGQGYCWLAEAEQWRTVRVFNRSACQELLRPFKGCRLRMSGPRKQHNSFKALLLCADSQLHQSASPQGKMGQEVPRGIVRSLHVNFVARPCWLKGPVCCNPAIRACLQIAVQQRAGQRSALCPHGSSDLPVHCLAVACPPEGQPHTHACWLHCPPVTCLPTGLPCCCPAPGTCLYTALQWCACQGVNPTALSMYGLQVDCLAVSHLPGMASRPCRACMLLGDNLHA